VVFSYPALLKNNGFARYSRTGGVYAEQAAPPPMPWKESPTEGIILGTLTDSRTGRPVTDAQVTRSGSGYVALSSADGLYSFLRVPPGPCTLMIRKAGLAERCLTGLVVQAGRVLRADAALLDGPAVVLAAGPGPRPQTAPASMPAASSPASRPVIATTAASRPEQEPRAPVAVVQRAVVAEQRPFVLGRVVFIGMIIAGLMIIVAVVIRSRRR
jgi:hypothetical protein